MNGRLYDPLLRRFLNADENIQDMFNTQNYNKYGYVLNNPLMFNDPSGEFIPLIAAAIGWIVSNAAAIATAAAIGAAVGLAAYTAGVLVTGSKWSFVAALKATFWGGISGAVTFGIGSIFSSAAQTLGNAILQAAAHGIAQGTLSLMQGASFNQAFISGALGSLGASAWGYALNKVGLSQFASNAVGTVAFGALSGGVGSALSGGNFWQGAIIGGIVAGLNHAMHSIKTDSPKDIIVLNASEGASGMGHNAVVIGNDKDGYVYISKDGRANGTLVSGGDSKSTVKTFATKQEALDFAKTQYKFDNTLTIKTDKSQDFKAIANAFSEAKKGYHVIYNNCSDVISGALVGAGLGNLGGYSVIPNINYQEIKNNFLKK